MKHIKPILLVLVLLAILLAAVSCTDAGEDTPGTSAPAGTEQTAQLSETHSGDVTEAPTEPSTDYDGMDTDDKWTKPY